MSVVLACAFPIFVVVVLLPVLSVRAPERVAGSDPRSKSPISPDTAPLSYKQHLAYNVPYLLASVALAYPLGVAQRRLIAIVGCDASSFCHRATDSPIYSFLPALFLGLVVCFPPYVRLMRWYLGVRFFEILDRPDRSLVPMSLRQDIRFSSGLTWAVAILATLVNLAAFDTFLQITEREPPQMVLMIPPSTRSAAPLVAEASFDET